MRTGPVMAAALTCTGLMAGLFFAFSVAVMPGLAATDDRTFVAAMQHVNAAIENGLFGLVFVGALLCPAVAALLLRRAGHRTAAGWTVGAAVLYLVVLVLTMAVEVPLNDRLARTGVRGDFEHVWVPVNDARTVLTVLALICLAVACRTGVTTGGLAERAARRAPGA